MKKCSNCKNVDKPVGGRPCIVCFMENGPVNWERASILAMVRRAVRKAGRRLNEKL